MRRRCGRSRAPWLRASASAKDPINGEGAFHSGIDIDAPYGTPVRAAGDGDVTGASMGAGYGREVVLNHGHDLLTLYGHLSAIAVFPGQHVTRGTDYRLCGPVGPRDRAASALRSARAQCARESAQVSAHDLRAGVESGYRNFGSVRRSQSRWKKRLPKMGAVFVRVRE